MSPSAARLGNLLPTMIITYPIQLPYIAGSEQRVVPDSISNRSEILSGSYLLGKNRFWHGGIHIHPLGKDTPIVAIADGDLIAYRYDEIDETDEYFNKTSCSRSFVLLKHEAELGQTGLGAAKLSFYSLYMHLRSWGDVKKIAPNAVNFVRKIIPERQQFKSGQPVFDKQKRPVMEKEHEEIIAPVANGSVISGTGFARVRRGDVLGYCGNIPDNMTTPSRGIHFEIFFDSPEFLSNPCKTIWGRCVLAAAHLVLDELLPEQTLRVNPAIPLDLEKSHSEGGYFKIKQEGKSYWVSQDQIEEVHSQVSTAKHKGKTRFERQHVARTDALSVFTKDPLRNMQTLAMGTVVVPWIGPWLEIDEFSEQTYQGKTWIPLFLPGKDKLCWVEKKVLNYTSDADWPSFEKFQEEEGQHSADALLDGDRLLEKLNSHNAAHPSAQEEINVGNLIAKHPTEWSKVDIKQRFERVTQEDFGPQKLSEEEFGRLACHIERLAFWEEVDGIPDAKSVWHAHPIRFIEHLAKCMWLSEAELLRIMPDTDKEVVRTHRFSLNKTMMQWGFIDRLEQAHFLAQGMHESAGMRLMTELPSKYASSASRYKGRGFVQITSEVNYNALNLFLNRFVRPTNLVNQPETLGSDSYLAFAASCWYWRSNDLRRSAKKGMEDAIVEEVGRVINRGPARRNLPEYPPLSNEDRLQKFHWVKKILLS